MVFVEFVGRWKWSEGCCEGGHLRLGRRRLVNHSYGDEVTT